MQMKRFFKNNLIIIGLCLGFISCSIERGMRGKLQSVVAHPLLHRLPADLADAVDMVKRLLRALQREKLRHRAVHRARAEAAPEGKDQGTAVVHAECLFRLRLCLGEKVAAHGRAGHDHLLRMSVVRTAVLKADHNALAVGLKLPRRQPRHDVRLMHRRGDARLRAVAHEGIARVSAGAILNGPPEMAQPPTATTYLGSAISS